MNTLKNHQILFDAECPMCKVYTQLFVSTGMLDVKGRAAYQEIPAQACPMLDRQRAANEIALINQETGEVTYGVQSLFKVLAVAYPVFKPLFANLFFTWLMTKLYAFISYNRRVIIPASLAESSFEIQPSFKLQYRLAYLLFTWIVTAAILSKYTQLFGGYLPAGNAYREYLICGGQIVFQGIVISLVNPEKRWAYLGNMMTISFAGALLLLPGLILATRIQINPICYLIWFMLVAGLMFLEHIRRSKLLKIGYTLTLTWVLYRLIVLFCIL